DRAAGCSSLSRRRASSLGSRRTHRARRGELLSLQGAPCEKRSASCGRNARELRAFFRTMQKNRESHQRTRATSACSGKRGRSASASRRRRAIIFLAEQPWLQGLFWDAAKPHQNPTCTRPNEHTSACTFAKGAPTRGRCPALA